MTSTNPYTLVLNNLTNTKRGLLFLTAKPEVRRELLAEIQKTLSVTLPVADIEQLVTGMFTEDTYFFDWLTQVPNHIDSTHANGMFETYGAELEFVIDYFGKHPERVWTLTEEDGVYETIQGLHHVNRVGYILVEEDVPDTGIVFVDAEMSEFDADAENED